MDEGLKGLWLVVMEKMKFWEILAYNFQKAGSAGWVFSKQNLFLAFQSPTTPSPTALVPVD